MSNISKYPFTPQSIQYVHNITLDQYNQINVLYNDSQARNILYQTLLKQNVTYIFQHILTTPLIEHICEYIDTPLLPHHLQQQHELEIRVQRELDELDSKQLQLHEYVLQPIQQIAEFELQNKLKCRQRLKQQYSNRDSAG